MMEIWNLTENPVGNTYQQLLEVLCDYSDTFYLKLMQTLSYSLYDWVAPNLPEGLTFIKTILRGSPVLHMRNSVDFPFVRNFIGS